ncbi:MAG TPA: alpha/beta hydrolase [Acetobacteraceae bacterium]
MLAGGLAYVAYAAWRYAGGGWPGRDRLGRLESRWHHVGGLRLHALASIDPVRADRTSVVLVHGLGVSSPYMHPIARHLAADVQVYAPDLPGFGRSDKPQRVLSIPELADTLAAWMEAAGLRRASLVGNSLGCEILVELALRHPGRVERLVLQGPTPEPGARTARQQLARHALTGSFERTPLGWVSLWDYTRCGVRRMVGTFRDMLSDHLEEKLPRVGAPTLVIRGTRDRIVSQAWAERAARLLPRGRLAVIPGAAHAINFSYPRKFKAAMLGFLLGRETAPSTTARPGFVLAYAG